MNVAITWAAAHHSLAYTTRNRLRTFSLAYSWTKSSNKKPIFAIKYWGCYVHTKTCFLQLWWVTQTKYLTKHWQHSIWKDTKSLSIVFPWLVAMLSATTLHHERNFYNKPLAWKIIKLWSMFFWLSACCFHTIVKQKILSQTI